MNRNRVWLFAPLVFTLLSVVSAQETIHVLNVGTPTEVRAFAPGRWSAVSVGAANPGQGGAVVRASVYDKADTQLRFGRDVWVPPEAVRWTTIPIHIPDETAVPATLEWLGHVESGGWAADGIAGTRLLRVAAEAATVFIGDSDPPASPVSPTDKNLAYELVVAVRVAHGLSRSVISPGISLLPASIHAWDSVSHVVVAGNRLVDEPGAAAALRGWVADGGRLWIQVNRAGPATVETLLDSAITITEVDRVPLNRFEIRDLMSTLDQPPLKRDLEEPVELIRAWVEGGRVLQEVDGWPAAVEVSFGRGRVLMTLLDAPGWLQPRGAEDASHGDPLAHSDFVPTEPLSGLSSRLLGHDVVDAPTTQLASDYLPDRIGYRIPGRGSVLAVLAVMCAVLIASGIRLSLRGRLEHLGRQSVLASGVATAVIITLGMNRRSEVPATVAQLRLVRIFPETGEQATRSEIAIFQPEQTFADFSGRDLLIDPQMPQLGGRIRRWIWQDGHRWRWESTRLPPGVLMMQGRSFGPSPDRLAARASFDADGLVGRIETPRGGDDAAWTSLVDPIVVFPDSRPLAAGAASDGSFRCGQRDLLAEGQFSAAALVGDDRRRRADVLRQWLPWLSATATVDTPVLVGWTDAWPHDLEAAAVEQRLDESLVVVPIRLAPTGPGRKVRIPSAAVRAQAVAGEKGVSGIFENRSQSWIYPNAHPTSTRLRFQLPRSVLPLRCESVVLVLEGHLPSRHLEVFVVSSGKRHSLGVWTNASGRVEARITDSQLPATDERGGLVFDIEVGELRGEFAEATMGNSGWSIRRSHLEVEGTTLEPGDDHRE